MDSARSSITPLAARSGAATHCLEVWEEGLLSLPGDHADLADLTGVEGNHMIYIARIARTAAAAAALTAVAVAGTPAAQAAPVHPAGFSTVQSCTSMNGKITYGKGLTKTVKTHHSVLTGTVSGCTGLNGAQSGTGTISGALVGKSSYKSVTETGTVTVNWPTNSGPTPRTPPSRSGRPARTARSPSAAPSPPAPSPEPGSRPPATGQPQRLRQQRPALPLKSQRDCPENGVSGPTR